MSKKPKVQTYSIPEFYMCYIAYGDTSNLTETEIDAFNQFEDDKTAGMTNFHWSISDGEGNFVSWHNLRAYGILPANCIDVDLVIMS